MSGYPKLDKVIENMNYREMYKIVYDEYLERAIAAKLVGIDRDEFFLQQGARIANFTPKEVIESAIYFHKPIIQKAWEDA